MPNDALCSSEPVVLGSKRVDRVRPIYSQRVGVTLILMTFVVSPTVCVKMVTPAYVTAVDNVID